MVLIASSCVFLLMLPSQSVAATNNNGTEDLVMKSRSLKMTTSVFLKYIFMHSTRVLDIVDVYGCVRTSRVAVGDTEREDIDINQF